MEAIFAKLIVTAPLAAVVLFIWWKTWGAWQDERTQRQKDQRRWTTFLMGHIAPTVSEEEDETDDEA